MPVLMPPTAEKHPKTTALHGTPWVDDYAWLRANSWQEMLKNPETLPPNIRAYLEAENTYTAAVTAPLTPLIEELFTEMKARIREEDTTPPEQNGPYFYYKRMLKGQQYPLYCRKLGSTGPEEVYFDANKKAASLAFYKLGALEVSPDHSKLAFTEDTNGSEAFTLRVVEIATGTEKTRPVPNLHGDVVWAGDNTTLYYTTLGENHNTNGVKRHKLGEDMGVFVYKEAEEGYFLSLSRSADEQYIFLSAGDHETSEAYYVHANQPEDPFVCFTPRQKGVRYSLEYGAGTFYILTNAHGAVDFKICTCTPANTTPSAWHDLIPHRAGYLPQSMVLTHTILAWTELHEAGKNIFLRTLATQETQVISFKEDAYNLDLVDGYMFGRESIRFAYSSPSTPSQIFDYNTKDHTRTLLKEQEVPHHNPADYITERLFAKGEGGVRIPITVFYHKDTPKDGTAPLWLYGYGAYGIGISAAFSLLRLTLVNRGFIFAIAHIRGGDECGHTWYTQTRKEGKPKTFADYIAVAEQLISEKYTAAGNIFAEGYSAGGLLMGAVTNLRPDLWRFVHLGVPFVDVLSTMCDPTLPLTPPEWPEWGNPIEDENAFKVIASYCPYTNLEKKAYPHVLVTSGLTDYRVTYWEPAKYVAKMRASNTADTLTLLKMEMTAGHGGASGRFDRLREDAFVFAVALALFANSPLSAKTA